ncbi:hypothetical protein CERSUDRAFT_85574 [Gelatoporia subvermispora B]|uniref:Multidrug resistance-associated ABC transporter n=1 Tax=Ceriporiopsis subvermispora (strain B) TaxID=914234 RepID=M2QU79_CERS8|nr:hypothetical protein CERSUDRAFT_85574 [Gelatoporia subvermispora B]
MPPYQLEAAIALTVSAICSVVIYLATRKNEGKIQLPVIGDEEDPRQDPFDVTQPIDLLDGYPIDEENVWNKMRVRKLTISVLLAAIAAIQSVGLGWSILDDHGANTIAYALLTAYTLYTLVIAVCSIPLRDSAHATAVVNLFTLVFLASAFLITTAILPSTPFPIAQLYKSSSVPNSLSYAALVLYVVALAIAISTPRGPKLHFPAECIYSGKTLSQATSKYEDNVCGVTGASIWDMLLFSYTTKVVMLGNTSESLEIGDLPIVPANMRATVTFAAMRAALRRWKLKIGPWRPKPGSGWELGYQIVRVNLPLMSVVIALSAIAAVLFYVPPFFVQRTILYLENDPERENRGWGWVFCAGLFFSDAISQLLTAQLFSLSTTELQVRVRLQLNSTLFAKTLVRKDVASSIVAPAVPAQTDAAPAASDVAKENDRKKKQHEESDFSSKAQIITLMTTDVDRVSGFGMHLFSLIDSPIEICVGTIFLYHLLGVSCFFGLAVTCLFMPMNHFAGKIVIGAQRNLMKTRDQRMALMNEVLGGIRMLKFMTWERSFEKRVLRIRERELKFQKLNYTIEVLWNAIWNASPIVVTLVSFWHFAVVRQQVLTPSIAFTSISVFNMLKYALNALPETLINLLQTFVSLRRIEMYLHGAEVAPVPLTDSLSQPIILQSATVTWPQNRAHSSTVSSAASTPRHKFILMDLSLSFPFGELSLICGKLGSGKSLLLLALLGEADLLAGQIQCPRTPPNAIASFAGVVISQEEWIVQGVCAYVPQSAWLRNASIRDNVLSDLPYDEERYQKTLEVCALLSDLRILEDGDMSEIGERGINLSGGQKARVSLARAVYSRASVVLLDDVLSAVDAHTAHHLYHECLKGDLMRGRTIILVSHHVRLCSAGAKFIVALDNGRIQFQGDPEGFKSSGVLNALVQSGAADASDDKEETAIHGVEEIADKQAKSNDHTEQASEAESSAATVTPVGTEVKRTEVKPEVKKTSRKLVEEERRAVGSISKDIWATYIAAAGGGVYWSIFALALILAALSPVLENSWLRIWSGSSLESETPKSPTYYITVYATITAVGLVISVLRYFVLYHGGIHASAVLHQKLLEGVLFATIRFHDSVSRGRLLNRFGKDIEGVDSNLPDNFGRGLMHALAALITFITITIVGGLPLLLAAIILGTLYYQGGKLCRQASRDMRRLDSVSRSPLYSIYGETIAGVTVIRAFGASSKLLRDMLRCVDTNSSSYYWKWGLNRWLSTRFNLLSCAVVGTTAVTAVLTPSISASLAGFALAFAGTITGDLLLLVRRIIASEQSMVAVERIKEFSEIKREPPEFLEPRPPASWPEHGTVKCENLCIRYAPDLPNVLHNLNFEVHPGEKIGVLGRTGSGKSTLALSFFRFVEPAEGRISIDDIDISTLGLTDLRSRLTIIPQDPTILSGTLRSTLDMFDEYKDADLYEALRRVHLIPSSATPAEEADVVNANVFRNLDSPVSEGGDNFSTGEKQLLCMARAILKRSKVLFMDEATASVDYATDELISKTIRQAFAQSTIFTIAHRLRTVIDYDRIMLLDEGTIVEFDKPATLLSQPSSKFYALCKATGENEFAVLRKMAGV